MGRHPGKKVATIVAASALVFGLAACSTDGGTSEETKAKITSAVTSTTEPSPAEALRSSIEATASTALSSIGAAWDDAKLSVFVAAFREAYPDLSSNRDDDAIRAIVKDTCTARDAGADEATLLATVEKTAADGATAPTREQAERILQMVRLACP
ncbi:hypothetical protein [Prescottella subtropica]|uniref:hypothetical protein n=1 Tax=Prescottella subtropica TaxID=2545757 RepID=UPI0010F6D85B|nr:hypothetical protein [Prescottella subtropica]